MDGGGVAGICLVIAGGDGPELLQLGEGVLDEVAPAIHVAIEVDRGLADGLGRDHRDGPAGVKVCPQPVHVEGFVAEQGVEGDARNQRPHADAVVALAGQQDEAHQVAEGVDEGDDLGGQTAARAADRLVPGPPLAPLAFWWAVTMVPSIRAYSKSGSSDRHAKTRSNTRPFTQRRNRWKTLFQRPKSPGRSRHGAPVRTRHSTASRNSRLSLAVAPGSDALPGNRGATFSQAASPTTNRTFSSIAPTPPKRSLNHGRSVGGIPQCQQALADLIHQAGDGSGFCDAGARDRCAHDALDPSC